MYGKIINIQVEGEQDYLNLIQDFNKQMTREEIFKQASLYINKNKYLILELITGYGKTKIAIDLINFISNFINNPKILILVAKTVHKQTWLNEINKWGGIKSTNIIIECYESFKKYENQSFDILVADEAQHLSENRLNILKSITLKKFIGLSATIKKDMKDYFTRFYNACIIKCGLREAINDSILPEPTVYLIPLTLDNKSYKFKTTRFNKEVILTQKGYYDNISSLIDWYKNKFMNSRNERIKTLWLSTAGKRLKWLSEQKLGLVLELLLKLKNYRTLTFCGSIEQSELLGKYNITSKNKNSIRNLSMFNDNKIKHITACNILNEGVNLYNCKIGIFCNINSSEIITKQRIGRLLRHPNPIVIIPYFKFTREEELVNKMIEEYSKESIKIINNIKDLKVC